MTLVWRPGFQFDADASTYIEAVEAADTQALETGVRYAINDFVIGCKNDGIWDAIKASCILAGARTLDGALVPLVGTAPTNFNFVSGDYNRETGLKGNGSNKYLDSNRANDADPQDSNHNALYVSETASTGRLLNSGENGSESGTNTIAATPAKFNVRNRSSTTLLNIGNNVNNSFVAMNRSTSSAIEFRSAGTTTTHTLLSSTPTSEPITLYYGNGIYTDPRLAFYSIGESLDLAALDTRVSNLITAIGAAIP
jgi:hypothetical protein